MTTNKKRLNLILDERELSAIERLREEMALQGVELSVPQAVHSLLRRAIANWQQQNQERTEAQLRGGRK